MFSLWRAIRCVRQIESLTAGTLYLFPPEAEQAEQAGAQQPCRGGHGDSGLSPEFAGVNGKCVYKIVFAPETNFAVIEAEVPAVVGVR